MTNTTADGIVAAIEDGEKFMNWAQANEIVLEDERIETAVLRALAGPVPPEFAVGVPLLRFANTTKEAIPLVDAVVDNDKRHHARTCDLCNAKADRTHRLLVPAGGSVVAIHCCFHCRDVLQDVFACSLVWD